MIVPLSISPELETEIRKLCKHTRLNIQETIRQALWVGIPALCNQWPKADGQPAAELRSDNRHTAKHHFAKKGGAK